MPKTISENGRHALDLIVPVGGIQRGSKSHGSHPPNFTKSAQVPRKELQLPVPKRAHLRMPAPVWKRAKVWLCQQPYILLLFWYELRLCFGSYVCHMRTLLSRKHYRSDLGIFLPVAPDGHLTANIRMDVREVGIQELETLYPWASNVESAIFLQGFDAGEQFALHRADSELTERAEAWLPQPLDPLKL